jgi:hypothetical protein
MKRFFSILVLACLTTPIWAQVIRPIPYPVIPNPKFDQAVVNGTRSEDGRPGASYWMNQTDYTIHASLSPSTKMLRGTEEVVYTNNSPDDLRTVVVHLHQNLHKEGVVRNRAQKLTGGINLSFVAFNGDELLERSSSRDIGYRINGTRMYVTLPTPIKPGASAKFAFSWTFEVPEAGAPRIGQDGEIFFVGYWFPQMAVYDDVSGWKADAYMGNGEFYADFGSYTVSLTVPEQFVIGATGNLINAEEVLSAQTLSRLQRAKTTDDIVRVVTADDRGKATKSSPTGTLTWKFKADKVRDFAFGTSDKYLWDATRAKVEGSYKDIFAFYRPEMAVWARSAEFARFTIEYLSKMLLPYPYPHMTTAEGVIGGGMEFPMITHIGGGRNDQGLFGVTFHEIGHMWFPMIVAQDEKEFTWMDEGLTSYNTSEGSAEFWSQDSWAPERQGYYRIAGTGDEVEPMRHGDQYPLDGGARGLASYNKPAVALNALRGIVGQERFSKAYKEYANRWAFKHPQPYDLFNTFNDVLGKDYDWFWTTMFFTTWTLDQAIAKVEETNTSITVTVEDLGLSPFPSPVTVTYANGETVTASVPVSEWLSGKRSATLKFKAGAITRVEIDKGQFLPDVDRKNNVWEK